MRFWRKELPRRSFYLPNGMPLKFDFVSDDYGFLACDQGWLNTELDKCVTRRSGGITEISQADYQAWLKKKSSLNSPQRQPHSRPLIAPMSRRALGRLQESAGPAAAVIKADQQMAPSFAEPQKSAGLTVDRTFTKPRVGKLPTSD